MANIVEFLVKMQDMMSGPLKKLSATGQQSFHKIEESMDRLRGKSRLVTATVSDIDKHLVELERVREISIDSTQIRRVNREMEQLERKKERLTTMGRGGGSSAFGGMFGIGTLFMAAYGLKDAMQLGIGRQMDLTGLEVLLGKSDGDRVNGQLLEFAKKSIYGNEVFNEGKIMAGSGVTAPNIMPVLHMIGDIAMGDKERMKSIALAFAEASSTGHLTGRQELMMRTALFNPLEQLHRMTGKSMDKLQEDMAKRRISIDMLVKSMEYATGPAGRFRNMMDKMQETPAGKWTAFTGTVRTLAGTLGLKLLPVLGAVTDFLTLLLDNTPALEGIVSAIGAMTAAWLVYTVATKGAAFATALLADGALWPILVAGAVAGGIAYLMGLNDQYADSTKGTANSVMSSGDLIRRFFETLSQWGTMIYDVFTIVSVHLMAVLKGLKDGLTLHISDAINELTNPASDPLVIAAYKKYDADKNKWDWHKAMDYNGLDDDGKPKKKGVSALDISTGKYIPAGKDAGESGKSTAEGITGGGVRNLTINVAKFQDKTEIHTVGLKEGVKEVEEIIRDMFLRITNSASAMVTAGGN